MSEGVVSAAVHESLLLVKFCGAPSVRVQLLQRALILWQGVVLSAFSCNCRLKVYCTNYAWDSFVAS